MLICMRRSRLHGSKRGVGLVKQGLSVLPKQFPFCCCGLGV